MARPRKTAVYSPIHTNSTMKPPQTDRGHCDWSWTNTLELCTVDSRNTDVELVDNMMVVSISREFKRRFGVLGDTIYKELICALKTVIWVHLKTDFPNSNPAINIILPLVDLGITVSNNPESTYLRDQRVMQEWVDKACQVFAEAIGL